MIQTQDDQIPWGRIQLLWVLTAWVTLYIEDDKYDLIAPDYVTAGAIKIMLKKGDRLDLENYRSFSTTNSTRKLVTGVINKVFCPERRSISVNIRQDSVQESLPLTI